MVNKKNKDIVGKKLLNNKKQKIIITINPSLIIFKKCSRNSSVSFLTKSIIVEICCSKFDF